MRDANSIAKSESHICWRRVASGGGSSLKLRIGNMRKAAAGTYLLQIPYKRHDAASFFMPAGLHCQCHRRFCWPMEANCSLLIYTGAC